MTSANSSLVEERVLANAMASFVQIGAMLVLLYWCFTIISPFLNIVIWGLIISIALYPTHVAMSARLGGREKLSASILVLIGLAIIVAPTWLLADSTIGGLQYVAAELADGKAQVPPPDDSVAEWPLIGPRVHELWSTAATNIADLLNRFEPQLRTAGQTALSFAGHTVATLFQFVFAMLIAGAFLMSAETGRRAADNFATSLVGDQRLLGTFLV